jgi:hypothetical protein
VITYDAAGGELEFNLRLDPRGSKCARDSAWREAAERLLKALGGLFFVPPGSEEPCK